MSMLMPNIMSHLCLSQLSATDLLMYAQGAVKKDLKAH